MEIEFSLRIPGVNLVKYLIALLACAGGMYGLTFFNSTPPAEARPKPSGFSGSPVDDGRSTTLLSRKDQERIIIGGIERQATDVRMSYDSGIKDWKRPKKKEGATPMIPADANDQVKMVSAALESEDHPERYSADIVTHSFDSEAFKSNPSAYAAEYAKVVEPGRVFAPAQPAEGVTSIRSLGSRHHRVQQGETVRLIAEASPGAPVSFTSFRFGQFENLLSSITVVADEAGKAQAKFTASSGTRGRIRILAASPLHTDQVEYVVAVALPKS